MSERDGAWEAGDIATAWHENAILEKFYAPILAIPVYADPPGRWPSDRAVDAAERAGDQGRLRYVSDTYRYPLYAWEAGKVVSSRPAQ